MEPTSPLQWWKDFADILQSAGTILIGLVAGAWALWRFSLRQERYPHIETSAEIEFIGLHGEYWIVEIIAYIDNKGMTQHRMADFTFDLYSMRQGDDLIDSEEYGGQTLFPHLIKNASFLPGSYKYFYVDPGIKAKYSYVTRIHRREQFLIFHYRFFYSDRRRHMHVAERTVKVPTEAAQHSS